MTTFRLVDGFGPPSPRDYRLTRRVLVAHMGHVRGWFVPANSNEPQDALCDQPERLRSTVPHFTADSREGQHDHVAG